MKKASNILLIIGIVHAAYMLVFLVALTISSFMISAPSYKTNIISQLEEGLIFSNIPGTLEEQANYIQHTFVIIGIVVLIISLIFLASLVIGFLAKKRDEKKYHIASLVLGSVSINIFFILANIFALVLFKREQDDETINVSF